MFAQLRSNLATSQFAVVSLGLAFGVLGQGYKKPGYDYSWIIYTVVGVVVSLVVISLMRKYSG